MSNYPRGPQDQRNIDNAALILRSASQDEIALGLGLILGSSGRLATDAQVREFSRFAGQRKVDLQLMRIAVLQDKLLWAVVPISSPGSTVLLFAPNQLIDVEQINAALLLTRSVCLHQGELGMALAQVLIEPEQPAVAGLYHELGFVEMADLIYLSTTLRRDAGFPRLGASMRWIEYSAETHNQFLQAIQESYKGSLDCPLLNGLRDMNDVILGHQAAGEFDPRLWFLLVEEVAGEVIGRGVLLLSRAVHGDAMELVYLGVPERSRGTGIGAILMQKALHALTSDRRRRLNLAVDSRNAPAMKLYFSFGFARCGRKMAMMRDLRALPRLIQPVLPAT